MLNCRFIPELDWFLIVEQNEQALLAPIKEQLLFNILLSLLVTAIVAWICGAVIRRTHIRIERRHAELTQINHQSEIQKAELSLSAEQLSSANQKLSELNKEKDDFIGICRPRPAQPTERDTGALPISRV